MNIYFGQSEFKSNADVRGVVNDCNGFDYFCMRFLKSIHCKQFQSLILCVCFFVSLSHSLTHSHRFTSCEWKYGFESCTHLPNRHNQYCIFCTRLQLNELIRKPPMIDTVADFFESFVSYFRLTFENSCSQVGRFLPFLRFGASSEK